MPYLLVHDADVGGVGLVRAVVEALGLHAVAGQVVHRVGEQAHVGLREHVALDGSARSAVRLEDLGAMELSGAADARAPSSSPAPKHPSAAPRRRTEQRSSSFALLFPLSPQRLRNGAGGPRPGRSPAECFAGWTWLARQAGRQAGRRTGCRAYDGRGDHRQRGHHGVQSRRRAMTTDRHRADARTDQAAECAQGTRFREELEVTCRPRAPRARRRPISPVRSRTATRVVFAMPTAPITRQMAASSRNSWLRSAETLPRRARGSGGGMDPGTGRDGRDAVPSGPAVGDLAGGTERRVEISILAPSSGGPQSVSATVAGTTTESRRSALRSTSSMIPTTVNGCSPMKRAGWVSSVVIPSLSAMPGTDDGDRLPGPRRVKSSYVRPAPGGGRGASRTPGEAARTGSAHPSRFRGRTGQARRVRVSSPPNRTDQYTPACRTPASACIRLSASSGNLGPRTRSAPGRCPRRSPPSR